MKRDPWTGLRYPFYSLIQWTWNAEIEEYETSVIADVQTYEEALAIIKSTPVSADVPFITIDEEYEDDKERIVEKVAVTDNASGFELYDPRTDTNII